MRTLPVLAAAALAGCGPGSNDAAGTSAARSGAAGSEASGETDASDELVRRATSALAEILPDAARARYDRVREGSEQAICGEIRQRQAGGSYGDPLPFVISPAGTALVSASRAIQWDNPADSFPDAYALWCASPEELLEIQRRLESMPRTSTPPARVPEVPPEAADPEPEQLDNEQQGQAGRRDPDDVSFRNAVVRPDR